MPVHAPDPEGPNGPLVVFPAGNRGEVGVSELMVGMLVQVVSGREVKLTGPVLTPVPVGPTRVVELEM